MSIVQAPAARITAVAVITGVFLVFIIPSYLHSTYQSRLKSVENNLKIIAGAQERFHKDRGVYFSSSDFSSINANLSLDIPADNEFNYVCVSPGASFLCFASYMSASPSDLPGKVSIDDQGRLTCARNSAPVSCP